METPRKKASKSKRLARPLDNGPPYVERLEICRVGDDQGLSALDLLSGVKLFHGGLEIACGSPLTHVCLLVGNSLVRGVVLGKLVASALGVTRTAMTFFEEILHGIRLSVDGALDTSQVDVQWNTAAIRRAECRRTHDAVDRHSWPLLPGDQRLLGTDRSHSW